MGFDVAIIGIGGSFDAFAIGIVGMFDAIVLHDRVLDVGRLSVVKQATLVTDLRRAVDVAALFERFTAERIQSAQCRFAAAQSFHHEFVIVIVTE